MAETTERKDSEMQEKEEKNANSAEAIRQSILSKYAQAGLNDKDAAEEADAFLRQHAFRPNAAEIDPQLAGLMERAAEAARQQAAEKKLAEEEAEVAVSAPEKTLAAEPAENESEKETVSDIKASNEAVKKEQDDEKDVPVFSAGVDLTEDKENQEVADKAADKEEDIDELEAQLLRTAWKNKFMLFEDEEANAGLDEDKRHKCPFAQCRPDTIKRHDNPLSVSMEFESGSTVTNSSKRVNLNYKGDAPSLEDCMAMARIGKEKGWKTAKLEGSDEYKAQMYLAMRAMGIKPIGYTPSPELQKQGDEIAAKHAQDREHAESMDQRYPALDKARGDMKFDKVDAEQYKAIRAKAEAEQEKTVEEVKTAEPAAKTPAPEKSAEDVKADEPLSQAAVLEKMAEKIKTSETITLIPPPEKMSCNVKTEEEAKTADADRSKSEFLKPGAFNDKLPEEKKAELSGKFDKMVATLREQHPNVAKTVDFKGKSPADLLKAYGNALTVVKKAEAKGSAKVASNALNVAKNRSGEGR